MSFHTAGTSLHMPRREDTGTAEAVHDGRPRRGSGKAREMKHDDLQARRGVDTLARKVLMGYTGCSCIRISHNIAKRSQPVRNCMPHIHVYSPRDTSYDVNRSRQKRTHFLGVFEIIFLSRTYYSSVAEVIRSRRKW